MGQLTHSFNQSVSQLEKDLGEAITLKFITFAVLPIN